MIENIIQEEDKELRKSSRRKTIKEINSRKTNKIELTKEEQLKYDQLNSNLLKTLEKAVPRVRTKGDYISPEARQMQSDWLSKNEPKRR